MHFKIPVGSVRFGKFKSPIMVTFHGSRSHGKWNIISSQKIITLRFG